MRVKIYKKKRQVKVERTHCRNGHPRNADNAYVDSKGSQDCRECRREADRRYKERKRQTGTS
ncbi:hypothetical protein [Streptomyces sp. NPDC058092]|uniref:hypothetical protein n=1 Tax=Streptomyces sp. NPDC058092 TaxID=3346336 RepID=UPI0036E4DB23